MEVGRNQSHPFRIGDWLVRPALDRIEKRGRRITLEPKAMDILVFLAQRPGEVISNEILLRELWTGQIVGDNTLYQWIYLLRKALGDDPHHPSYIETIPKRGYRLVAALSAAQQRGWRLAAMVSTVTILAAGLMAVVWFRSVDITTDSPLSAYEEQAPAIAVLPFTNLTPGESEGEGEDHDPLTAGTHEEVLNALAMFSGLKVISRTSVMSYRDTVKTAQEIGSELDVSHILKGQVQLVDDRLNVSVQLMEAETAEEVWTGNFDRGLNVTSMFEMQNTIAAQIVRSLELEHRISSRIRPAPIASGNQEAYEAYLTGKHLLAKRTEPALREAAGHFSKAIASDPGFALAHVGLADASIILGWYVEQPSDELLNRARQSIDRALKLDNRLGEAYASLGSFLTTENPQQAEAAFIKSIELRPNYAPGHNWYGTLLREEGRLHEAIVQYEKARQLDPLSAIINSEKAWALEEIGRFDEALALYEKVNLIHPNFRQTNYDQAILHWLSFGRVDKAISLFLKETSRLNWGSDLNSSIRASELSGIAFAFMELGAYDIAAAWLEKAFALEPEHARARYASIYLSILGGEGIVPKNHFTELLRIQSEIANDGDARDIAIKVLKLLRNSDLKAGRYASARSRYEQNFPELLQSDFPVVNKENYEAAIDLALVLSGTGEHERARQLLDGSMRLINDMPRLGFYGYAIDDVMIHALQGRENEALAALNEAINDGWRWEVRYQLEHEPNLFGLHDNPEYQSLVSTVLADLENQLRQVRQMELNVDWALLKDRIK
jgi:DNA-binding winged helix-turn-helix (wHTH) protein/TolB-like protein